VLSSYSRIWYLISISRSSQWWQGTLTGLKDNIIRLKQNFRKEVGVIETGHPWTLKTNDAYDNNFVKTADQLHPGYAATPTDQARFITDLRNTVRDAGGLGVFLWAADWFSVGDYGTLWENVALFDFSGKVLPGLKAMGAQVASSPPPPPSVGDWRGVDVSNLLQVEQAGGKFKNKQGQVQPLPQILADEGVNNARIRLFHTPKNGECCNLNQALTLAKRLDEAGVGVTVAFQFSDTWASASQQKKPGAWANKNFNDLAGGLHSYSRDVMMAFYNEGIEPVAVQLGNVVCFVCVSLITKAALPEQDRHILTRPFTPFL